MRESELFVPHDQSKDQTLITPESKVWTVYVGDWLVKGLWCLQWLVVLPHSTADWNVRLISCRANEYSCIVKIHVYTLKTDKILLLDISTKCNLVLKSAFQTVSKSICINILENITLVLRWLLSNEMEITSQSFHQFCKSSFSDIKSPSSNSVWTLR